LDCDGACTRTTPIVHWPCSLLLFQAMARLMQMQSQRHMAKFYFDHQPKRGYPESAIAVLQAVRNGVSIDETATMCFKDGSYANGAAMRIGPLALFFPATNFNYQACFKATAQCVRSSHVHPDAVESAALLAWAIYYVLHHLGPVEDLFVELLRHTKEPALEKRLLFLRENQHANNDFLVLSRITDYRFQIYAPDALATALWFFVTYVAEGPRQVIQKCVSFGGDTDTTGAMAGYLVGARFGYSWIPRHWFDSLENGEFGRDYAIQMASKAKPNEKFD
jgi:poly(ADP-ribose) glycohydrolase ARH3